ncbi:MAG: hypothetical protein J6T10_22575 [Methanobrevibacter sp.]|nr:hypothetical protein [Methanobrevibacter sp.]
MKIKIIALLLSLSIIIGYNVSRETLNNCYSRLMYVNNIEIVNGNKIITFTDCNNNVYTYNPHDNDIYIGDYYNCIIVNGKIVKITYERMDLFN